MYINMNWALNAISIISALCMVGTFFFNRSIEKTRNKIIEEKDLEIAMLKTKLAKWE